MSPNVSLVKKIFASLIPIIGILVSIGGAFLLGVLMWTFISRGGPGKGELIDSSTWIVVLAWIPFMATLYTAYFNVRFLLAIWGKVRLRSLEARNNRFITWGVTALIGLFSILQLIGAGISGGYYIIQAALYAAFCAAILGIGHFPYFLQKRFGLTLQ